MSEPERLDLGKLTKEIVSSRLVDVPDAPAVAGEVVKKTIVAGVTAARARKEDPRLVVQDVVHGAMMGLILIDKDLPTAAASIMANLSEAANEVHVDPQEMLTWALEGMAKGMKMASPDVEYKIRAGIDKQFMGAGEVFDKLCKQEKSKA
ncbi:MAG: hypothetical protein HY925_13520 [Elusimicrobia bacterium]|nr:hypothetical protein [Elusimicrobiota bacterium]